MSDDTPVTFKNAAAFRAWLTRHHASTDALTVRLTKVRLGSGLTYAQALDEALCFGWIDGVRRSLDADSYSTRFTPRRPRSIWSRVNIAHVARLKADGRMTPAGLAAFDKRDEQRSGIYSFERQAAEFSPAFVKTFKANKAAWAYYQDEAPWYRRVTTHWVTSAKREETRAKRLTTLIDCCARAQRIPGVPSPRSTASRPPNQKSR
jgi:uncharacterized protein YdeI (YjbR/CyaY-like superfamily)